MILVFVLLLSWYHLFYTSAGTYARNIINSCSSDNSIGDNNIDKNKGMCELILKIFYVISIFFHWQLQ